MSKYIIKNCEQVIGDNFCCSKNALCSDCTDCKLKQIVEECNNAKMMTNNYSSDSAYNEADRILQLLDIQEVE